MNAGERKVRQQARYLNNKLFGDGGRAGEPEKRGRRNEGPQRYEIMARSGIGRSPIADRPTKGHRLRVPGVDCFAARRSSNAVVTKKRSGTNLRPE
ncbi:unnamed protein product [Sphagnum troendelagicum]|uniref:Ribosomal protein S4 n=1 Tax=Sphagnum jensenii TaxID=128206 RepID=A0ABP0W4B3_9BRYO